MKNKQTRGYTLVELIVAIGLFALIMVLAAGAYLVMIGIARQTQGITAGINNVSFAVETMARTIRTSTNYGSYTAGTDCSGGPTFSVKDVNGDTVTYTSNSGAITQQLNSGAAVPLTDSSISITSLLFYSFGVSPGDATQARVTIVVSGTVVSGVDKTKTVPFTVETSATMRGSDI